MRLQLIAPVDTPGWCLVNNDEGAFGGFELRNPDKPGVVRKLKNLGGLDFITSPLVQSKDRSEAVYMTGGHLTAVKFADGTTRRGTTMVLGEAVGAGGEPSQVVVMGREALTLMDLNTLTSLGTIPAPRGYEFKTSSGGSSPAVSPDGKWLFCNIQTAGVMGKSHPTLVNLQERRLQTTLPPMDSDLHVAEFSPDSRSIVGGHQGGAVSLWNVAGLSTAGMDVKIPAEPAAVTGATPSRTNQAPALSPSAAGYAWTESKLAPTPFPLKDGDTWTVTVTGSVKDEATQFDAGRLLINDEPATPRALRSRRSTDPEGFTLLMEFELRSPDNRLRVHRQLRGYRSGSMRWIDTVENLSPEPQTLALAVESALGGHAKDLRGPDGETPAMQSGGVLDVASPVTSLGMETENAGVKRSATVCFGSETPPFYPAIKWNEATRSVRYEWALRLEPMQRRMIIHECARSRVVPEAISATGQLSFSWLNLRDTNMTARLPYMLNYAPAEKDKWWVEDTLAKSRVDAEGFFKDQLGFKWRHGVNMAEGMTAELGADRVLQIWLNGSPATFIQPATRTSADRQVLAQGMACHAVEGPVTVTRERMWIQREGACFMDDAVVNTGQEVVKTRVEFAIVASSRFTGLLGGDGRALDVERAVPVSDCRGKVAILGEGEDKPAILVGVGDGNEGSPSATVRWVKGHAVYVTYELDLKPGQQVQLLHFAVQRPLGAYETPVEGMAQLDVARMLKLHSVLQRKTPVNWSMKAQ